MPHTLIQLETFATAEDGAILQWDIYVPDPVQFPGARPGVALFESGGFSEYHNYPRGPIQMQQWASDMAERGWIVYTPKTREDDPAHWIPGQTVNGIYPTQINDAKRAVLAIYADTTRCNGQLILGGGSGGASLAGYVTFDQNSQSTPIAWSSANRPLACVLFSPCTDLSARDPQYSQENYFVNVCQTWGASTDLGVLLSKSVVTLVVGGDRPAYVVDGGHPEDGEPNGRETMPPSQRLNLTAKFDANSDTAYISIHIPDGGHSFTNYPRVKDASGGYPPLLDWMASIFSGAPPPPPPPPGSDVPKGCAVLYGASGIVDQSVLDDKEVDAISLRQDWADVEPTGGTLDTTYLVAQTKRIAAAGKIAVWRILTGGGAKQLGGHQPNWLFTDVATYHANDSDIKQSVAASTVSGTKTVTLTGGDAIRLVWATR